MGSCEVWQKFVIIISKAGSDETIVNETAYDNILNLNDTFQCNTNYNKNVSLVKENSALEMYFHEMKSSSEITISPFLIFP